MSITNTAKDRDGRGRLKRNLRGPGSSLSTLGYWVRLHMNRPRRKENRHLCHLVDLGSDPDDLCWPIGSRKPHTFYF